MELPKGCQCKEVRGRGPKAQTQNFFSRRPFKLCLHMFLMRAPTPHLQIPPLKGGRSGGRTLNPKIRFWAGGWDLQSWGDLGLGNLFYLIPPKPVRPLAVETLNPKP